MLKILIVGLGIGRRHLMSLRNWEVIEIASLRTYKGILTDNLGIQQFFTLEDALKFNPDGVIISNPTSLHVQTALPFLENNIKVLIEKPVSNSILESKLLNPYDHNVRIAYAMRFHPLNKIIYSIIKNEDVFKVGFKRSYYLPKWHPYADYRLEYTAKKELGGGVSRTLSHEIDLMLNWFGYPLSINGVVDKVSNLDIDTDDYACLTCGFTKGFRVNFELDFLSPINVNLGELFTNRGKYEWNMNELYFTPYDKMTRESISVFNDGTINFMFNNQIEDFLNFIRNGESFNATLKEGVEVLNIIESLKQYV